MSTRPRILSILVVAAAALLPGPARAAGMGAATPPQLVATYEDLADAILALDQTETSLVQSILATTYRHAEAVMAQAEAQLEAGKIPTAQIETLAELVAQLGNEGDAAVAAVRKRLVEGGHHHHAGGEAQGKYDPGFVVVTREAKKVFIDAASGIGKLATRPNLDALKSQWERVEKQFAALSGSS